MSWRPPRPQYSESKHKHNPDDIDHEFRRSSRARHFLYQSLEENSIADSQSKAEMIRKAFSSEHGRRVLKGILNDETTADGTDTGAGGPSTAPAAPAMHLDDAAEKGMSMYERVRFRRTHRRVRRVKRLREQHRGSNSSAAKRPRLDAGTGVKAAGSLETQEKGDESSDESRDSETSQENEGVEDEDRDEHGVGGTKQRDTAIDADTIQANNGTTLFGQFRESLDNATGLLIRNIEERDREMITRIQELEGKLNEKDVEIANKNTEIANKNKQISDQTAEITSVKAQNARLRDEVEQANRAKAQVINFLRGETNSIH